MELTLILTWDTEAEIIGNLCLIIVFLIIERNREEVFLLILHILI